MAATDGQTTESGAIDAAAARLSFALDALEAVAERRREADRKAQALSDQFHALDGDRARLASELDEAAARAKELETVNREVAERVGAVIETIRGVLNSDV
jgi:chromosome segregation ATPase